jgi:hypothetical protein
MVDSLKITSSDLAALTKSELDAFDAILKTGDRGGFYIAYNAMTGSGETSLQSRVATFSGLVGGGAFAANRLLQEAFGPGAGGTPEYKGIYYLSQRIAEEALKEISAAADQPNGGNVDDNTLFPTTQRVWTNEARVARINQSEEM